VRDGRLAGQDIAEVGAITRRLRPLAQITVDAMLAQAIADRLQEALGDHFAAVLEHLKHETVSSVRSG
jgi:hypothetical protein